MTKLKSQGRRGRLGVVDFRDVPFPMVLLPTLVVAEFPRLQGVRIPLKSLRFRLTQPLANASRLSVLPTLHAMHLRSYPKRDPITCPSLSHEVSR